MRKYFNMLFYIIFKFEYRLHIFLKKINPVVIIHKLIMSKDKHKKYIKILDQAIENPKNGISSMIAAGLLYGLFFILSFSIFIFFTGVFKANFQLNKLHGILIALPSIILLYFMVFKDDLYLKYFDSFSKIQKKRMRVLSILYFLNIIGIIVIFILSLMFMSYRNY